MSTKQPFNRAAAHRAIILMALFASVGKTPPTIGEVMHYCNKWGKRPCTAYTCQNELAHLIDEGYVIQDFRPWGKMKIRNYSLTQAGALLLVSLADHLPAQIQKSMKDLFERTAAAAAAVLLKELGAGDDYDN